MSRFRGSTFQNHKWVREKPAARQCDDVYLNEGHDLNNAAQMKAVMESNGGIPGLIIKYVKLSEVPAAKTVIKWDGISALNNFQFFPELNLMVLQRRLITSGPESWHHGKTFKSVASFLIRSKFRSLLIHVLS